LQPAIDRSRREDIPLTIVIIDVGAREEPDDWLDAESENRFLRETSLRWASTLRGTDLLARLAENTFGILLSQSDERSALDVVTRLVDTLPATREFAVGIAQWDGSEDVDALVARAQASIGENKPSR
jgi:PleD family two-component response regulator